MKYFWTCWMTKSQLESYGAINLKPSNFYGSLHDPKSLVYENHSFWLFCADDSFPLFVKLKLDKSIAEISVDSYYIGEGPEGVHDPVTSQNIMICRLDF